TLSIIGEELSRPIGLAISHDHFLYVTELDRSRVVQVAPDGVARVIAGDFNQAAGITIGPHANKPVELVVADSGNYLVRKLEQSTVSSETTSDDPLPKLTKETLGVQSLIWPV